MKIPHIEELVSEVLSQNEFPEITESLDNSKMATWHVLKKNYLPHVVVILGISIFLCLIIWNQLLKRGEEFGAYLMYIVVAFNAIIYWHIRTEAKSLFMKQFAKENNFKFRKEGMLKSEYGLLFYIGYRKKAYNFIEGSLGSVPFRMFEYKFTEGHGRDASRYKNTVLCLELDANIPRIYLDAYHLGDVKAAWPSKYDFKELSLESNKFNSQYNLFITKDQHIPALQIFTPDIMEKLIKLPTKYRFDIELVGNRLYIYENKEITLREELVAMLDVARHLIKNLSYVLSRVEREESN